MFNLYKCMHIVIKYIDCKPIVPYDVWLLCVRRSFFSFVSPSVCTMCTQCAVCRWKLSVLNRVFFFVYILLHRRQHRLHRIMLLLKHPVYILARNESKRFVALAWCWVLPCGFCSFFFCCFSCVLHVPRQRKTRPVIYVPKTSTIYM